MNEIVFRQFYRRNSGLLGTDRIVGNRVLLAISARLLAGKVAYRDFLGLITLIFVTSAILFSEKHKVFWELIFCMFCYSYTGIRLDGIVPKQCAPSNMWCLWSYTLLCPFPLLFKLSDWCGANRFLYFRFWGSILLVCCLWQRFCWGLPTILCAPMVVPFTSFRLYLLTSTVNRFVGF